MDIKCYKVMDDTWEQLKQASADEHINLSITFDNYNIDILDKIYNLHPNTTILINTTDFELTQQNSIKLQQGNDHIKSKYGAQTLFDDGARSADLWSVDKAINASNQLENWTQEINNAQVNGRELSPFEKYLYAYQIVTSYVFHEVEDGLDKGFSRELIGVLNSNNIVCVGYANLLSEICKRVGIKCEAQHCITNDKGENNLSDNHQNCNVEIHDELYGIDGIFYSDPCWDAKSTEQEESTYHNAFIEFEDVGKIFGKTASVDPSSVISMIIQKSKQTSNLPRLIGEEKKQRIASRNEFVTKKVTKKILKLRQELEVENEKESLKPLRMESKILPLVQRYLLLDIANNSSNSNAKDVVDILKLNKEQIIHVLKNYSDEQLIEQMPQTVEMNLHWTETNLEFNDEMVEWADLRLNPTHISKKSFGQALKNVYMARGLTKEQAEEKVRERFTASVDYCMEHRNITNETNNIFIQEAYDREQSLNV